jgi:hypothetical protein
MLLQGCATIILQVLRQRFPYIMLTIRGADDGEISVNWLSEG